MIENPNGQRYVGKTYDLFRRIRDHRNIGSHKKNRMIKGSILSHGWHNHEIHIIEENIPENEANSKEIFWIRTKMSNYYKWPEMKGLNLTDGGKGTLGHKSPQKGRPIPEERKKKIADGHRGKPLSQEHIKKLSESHLGQISNKKKAIICYKDMNYINRYACLADASKDTGCSKSSIFRVCHGVYDTFKGLKFKFE